MFTILNKDHGRLPVLDPTQSKFEDYFGIGIKYKTKSLMNTSDYSYRPIIHELKE